MTSKTVLLALVLSVLAVPALADCPGHKKVSANQAATTSLPGDPVIQPKASS